MKPYYVRRALFVYKYYLSIIETWFEIFVSNKHKKLQLPKNFVKKAVPKFNRKSLREHFIVQKAANTSVFKQNFPVSQK